MGSVADLWRLLYTCLLGVKVALRRVWRPGRPAQRPLGSFGGMISDRMEDSEMFLRSLDFKFWVVQPYVRVV